MVKKTPPKNPGQHSITNTTQRPCDSMLFGSRVISIDSSFVTDAGIFKRLLILLRYDCCACPTYKVNNLFLTVILVTITIAILIRRSVDTGGGIERTSISSLKRFLCVHHISHNSILTEENYILGDVRLPTFALLRRSLEQVHNHSHSQIHNTITTIILKIYQNLDLDIVIAIVIVLIIVLALIL